METIPVIDLLQFGALGFAVIVLLAGAYERREMRKEQYELIKLILAIAPEVNHLVSPELKRKIEVSKLNGE